MANDKHARDDDRGSVIDRLRRIRDMQLGREPSKISEIDDELDLLIETLASEIHLIHQKLDAIILAVGDTGLQVNVEFGTPEPKDG